MRISMYARWAALLLGASSLLSARVKTGLDVLVEQDFAPLAGKRIGVSQHCQRDGEKRAY
jgi:hypothetical protein